MPAPEDAILQRTESVKHHVSGLVYGPHGKRTLFVPVWRWNRRERRHERTELLLDGLVTYLGLLSLEQIDRLPQCLSGTSAVDLYTLVVNYLEEPLVYR